jgi:hypothetical protein
LETPQRLLRLYIFRCRLPRFPRSIHPVGFLDHLVNSYVLLVRALRSDGKDAKHEQHEQKAD